VTQILLVYLAYGGLRLILLGLQRCVQTHNRLVAGSSPAGPTIPFGHVGPHFQTQRTAPAAPSMVCCAAGCFSFQVISSTSSMPQSRQTQAHSREAVESRMRPASRGMRAAMV